MTLKIVRSMSCVTIARLIRTLHSAWGEVLAFLPFLLYLHRPSAFNVAKEGGVAEMAGSALIITHLIE